MKKLFRINKHSGTTQLSHRKASTNQVMHKNKLQWKMTLNENELTNQNYKTYEDVQHHGR